MKCKEQEIQQELKMSQKVYGEVLHGVTGIQKQMQQLHLQIEKVVDTGIIKVDGVPATSVMKPPTFDVIVPWFTYVREFEAAATGNNWSPSEKARGFVLALRGEAMEVLLNIPEEKQNDYELLLFWRCAMGMPISKKFIRPNSKDENKNTTKIFKNTRRI